MDGWSGHLLIAPAWMIDPNFAHSIVLLLHHDRDGAFGLVLNRPTRSSVSEVWQQATGSSVALDLPLFLGGPVPGPLMALHDREEHGERLALEGLYATSDPERLGRLFADPGARLRVFAGYSGWVGEQLERELQDAGWATAPAEATDVFCEPGEQVWRTALRRASGQARELFIDPEPGPPRSPEVN